ncbi:hypothetical protein HBN50_13795 [Halobacteriovorax sp. GB3]|uniref:hypothetical protein n=1 Tax=Halobacteriovorax sp. GB3 TaxID=2719615 RepID=UPI0023611DCA|nr:hypothetical protein [Halobacteriovorax sp. GB3]MDD0854181.1 hypothetical protein [Halobacteriovorax sp. GB3]
MKKILLMTLIGVSSFSCFAKSTKSFEFRDAGVVKFSDLERELSPSLSYADVKILNIRHSYHIFYQLGALVDGSYRPYVISLLLNGRDKVTCALYEVTDKKKMFIYNCSSSTASVDPSGFIEYRDLGKTYNSY